MNLQVLVPSAEGDRISHVEETKVSIMQNETTLGERLLVPTIRNTTTRP
jgi:hypothetical protein